MAGFHQLNLRDGQTFGSGEHECDLVTDVIESPVGLPGRAIRNEFLDDVRSGMKKPYRCPWTCLQTCPHKKAPYCIGDALISAKTGELEHGFPFAGANAWRVNEIVSVAELMQELEDEYLAVAAPRLSQVV